MFGLTVFMSVKKGSLYQNFLEGMSVGVALLATGLFSLLQSVRLKPGGLIIKIVTKISKASFCIYLSHVFVIYLFNFLNISVGLFPCLISIPLLSLANLALSYCCYCVMSKIPIVGRWLV